MRSLIDVSQLSKNDIEHLFKLFKDFKGGLKKSLNGDVALLFLEASTRTRLSFQLACERLNLNTYYVGRGESSIEKGESFRDTLMTLQSLGFRAVIFRVPFLIYPYRNYQDIKMSLVNAGDGSHQHPTQGLLDLFTLFEVYASIEGLNILFVGDILHSRVFRSSSYLFKLYGANVGVCAPKTLMPIDLSPFSVDAVFDVVEDGIAWADVVIYLRLQEERFKENFIPSKESYFLQFGLTKERYKNIKGYFMHPGPVNAYVDMDGDLIYSEKSLVLKQVENGVYTRMAVMYYLLSDAL